MSMMAPSLSAHAAHRPPRDRPSTLSALGADNESLRLKALPHGETEVHVHGGCYRLVPSLPSRLDPFNHANEMVVATCN